MAKKESLLIEINEKEYFKSYKDIIKFCLKEGVLLPSILEFTEVPSKYDFSIEELEKMKISSEASHRRQQAFMDREVLTSKIVYDGDVDKFNDELALLWNDELTSFITLYPQFKKIIK